MCDYQQFNQQFNICHDATCDCKGRVKRGLNTHVHEVKTNKDRDQVPKLEKPTCKITYGQENYCHETNSQEFPTTKKSGSVQRSIEIPRL